MPGVRVPAAPPRPVAARTLRRRRARRPAAWRALLRPRVQLPLLLVATTLAMVLVWQVRLPFTYDLGSRYDDPYLTGFHASEVAPDTGLPFRWTRDRAALAIPGFGATDATLTLRLQGARPVGEAPPTIAITLGEVPPTTLALAAEPRDYTFDVPATAFRDGGLRIAIDAPTYRPPGDRRDLGVIATRVALRDASGASGLVAPPLGVLGVALLAVLCAYGAIVLTLGSAPGGALAGWLVASALVACALGPRFLLAGYAPALAALVALGTVASGLTWLGLRWLRRRFGWASSERALGGAALLAGANLLILLIGMRHPLYRSSDLLLNVHRLEFVQRGEWVFTLALPGERALEAPYPPLFYAVMLPFSYIVADKALLVEVVAALAVAGGALLTFALARRATGADAPALWAAGIYAVLPITYAMASAGNFANLFGQGIATAYLVALVLAWGRWARPLVALGLTIGLTLALLGHFGVFLSLLVALPLLVLVSLTRGREARTQALALAGSVVVALALSWAVYYRFHSELLLGHVGAFLGGDTNARGGSAATVTLAQRLRNEWGGLLLWWGWPALPLLLAGSNGLRRLRPSPAVPLVITWLGTAVPFLLAALVAGLSVRFHLFVAPALAVVAGWALWQLWRSHRLLGPLVSLTIGAIWLWQGMSYWVDRVLHAYH